ncbi:TIR domain-containing protein [Salegentibacter sp. 24]|uniref:toll/interleukin-1 receptor domain-containing protein n=1 Tax=Salegentibacter sp. 24 TaxID=2183986 RepID=UPI00105B266D|nr:toll/interleukin-1 receptor domain-containing protein [Salegentibacter sp. 24]TDN93391.1 TIR domain-containing protein [Salegentibacter sp. 24]
MEAKYQLILLGSTNDFKQEVISVFLKHIQELGMNSDSVEIISEKNFNRYRANFPVFCIYFGDTNSNYQNLDLIKQLLADSSLILPVVSNLKNLNSEIPEILRSINGFELNSKYDIEKLVSCTLEGLSLLRLSRRVFISYKRDESSSVAIQLYEKLEANGFDVFLDTHSVRPGEPFQDELWHRMADTDLVLLLNTSGFLKSEWTTKELAKANSMSIGIYQLIWPDHKQEREAELTIPMKLTTSDFIENGKINSRSILRDESLIKIVSQSESLRARSLASRQDNIISEFLSTANNLRKAACLQSEKFITLKNSDNEEVVIIPTVGVPQAFTYNQSEELISQIKNRNVEKAYILYDHRNIREKWINHLSWLDNYLPIKTIKIIEAEKWLKKI